MNIPDAEMHCKLAHKDQKDKCGQPYQKHPEAVADLVAVKFRFNVNLKVVSLLHDVFEDQPDYELPIGGKRGLSLIQADALIAITRGALGDETYKEYIYRCARNYHACIVKKEGDLPHNMSPERHDCLGDAKKGLMKRYEWARDYLEEYYDANYA